MKYQIISFEDGKEYANKIKGLFFETSAKDNESIEIYLIQW